MGYSLEMGGDLKGALEAVRETTCLKGESKFSPEVADKLVKLVIGRSDKVLYQFALLVTAISRVGQLDLFLVGDACPARMSVFQRLFRQQVEAAPDRGVAIADMGVVLSLDDGSFTLYFRQMPLLSAFYSLLGYPGV